VNSSTPLYVQVSQKLAAAISGGVWHANEALPSERALCDALGISRITARKAMQQLYEQGLIVRRQGSGTYITPMIQQPLSRLTSFSEELQQRGFKPGSKWLMRALDQPTQDEMLKLGLVASMQVARLNRLRTADNVVMAIENTVIPGNYLPDPKAVADSLYATLESRGIFLVRAVQHIRAIKATVELAKLAQIKRGDAMLFITRIGYLENNVAVELTHTYCRNDYYDFVAELRR
jgi:GntR family transcriptional regulator